VTNPGNKTVTGGQLLSFTITGSDPNAGQTRTYSAGTTLPSGASLNATTGAFAWTPATAQASTSPYSVTVTATDNGTPALTSAPVTFTITVNAPPPPTQTDPRLSVRNAGTERQCVGRPGGNRDGIGRSPDHHGVRSGGDDGLHSCSRRTPRQDVVTSGGSSPSRPESQYREGHHEVKRAEEEEEHDD
jgi:hypothetical protein